MNTHFEYAFNTFISALTILLNVLVYVTQGQMILHRSLTFLHALLGEALTAFSPDFLCKDVCMAHSVGTQS